MMPYQRERFLLGIQRGIVRFEIALTNVRDMTFQNIALPY